MQSISTAKLKFITAMPYLLKFEGSRLTFHSRTTVPTEKIHLTLEPRGDVAECEEDDRLCSWPDPRIRIIK